MLACRNLDASKVSKRRREGERSERERCDKQPAQARLTLLDSLESQLPRREDYEKEVSLKDSDNDRRGEETFFSSSPPIWIEDKACMSYLLELKRHILRLCYP